MHDMYALTMRQLQLSEQQARHARIRHDIVARPRGRRSRRNRAVT